MPIGIPNLFFFWEPIRKRIQYFLVVNICIDSRVGKAHIIG